MATMRQHNMLMAVARRYGHTIPEPEQTGALTNEQVNAIKFALEQDQDVFATLAPITGAMPTPSAVYDDVDVLEMILRELRAIRELLARRREGA